MNSSLIKSRLDQINRTKKNLTPEEMLMLLTQVNPDLNSGSFIRLFTVTPPVTWEFYSASPQQIEISLELIALIEAELIPAYKGQAASNAWLQQCILFKLNHLVDVDIDRIVSKFLPVVKTGEHDRLNHEILKIISTRKPSAVTIKLFAQVSSRIEFYSDAIQNCELYFEQYAYDEELYLTYIDCLIKRKRTKYDPKIGEFSDLQYAIFLLCSMKDDKSELKANKSSSEKNTGTRKALLDKAVTGLLPKEILETRPEATNDFADLGRGVQSFSKGLGKFFGGRDKDVPYSKGVIESAPKLLDNQLVVTHIDKNQKAQTELKKIISARGEIFGVGVASTAFTMGAIWDYAHLDSSVLNALSFASAGKPEDFDALQDIAVKTLDIEGAEVRLSGYVAEQQAAMNLQHQGHTVEFPDTANQSGYDLIVDGTPMQVKCSMDADYVLSHFDKYPDIPVIVNSELAGQLGDHPMVLVDNALSYDAVQETTSAGLEAIGDFSILGEALPIPVLTIAFSAYRNFGDYNSGRIDADAYLKNVGVDTVAIGGGAALGMMILGGIATVATGGGAAPLVAAGIGSYVGGVAGSTGASAINHEALCNQRDVVVKLLIEFATWFKEILLAYRLKLFTEQLDGFKHHLARNEEHIITFSTFVMYQHEAHMRASHLDKWLSKMLNGNEMEKVQAGRVALAASGGFVSVEANSKKEKINQQFEIYNQLKNPDTKKPSGAPQLKPA